MVVLKVNKDRLKNLTGIDLDKIEYVLESLAVDIKRDDQESWDLELYPDRPDLYSIFGLSRSIRQFIFMEEKSYKIKKSGIDLIVDPNMKKVRPFIGAAAIKNISFKNEDIKDIMDLQEKLHLSLGRNRKKIAIGIHDLDKVLPPFRYAAEKPDRISFVPLGFDIEMNLLEIIKNHPKGIEYGDIIKNFETFPVILDSNNNVLSFPPIINGKLTQVTEKTKNIFIDVTGTDLFTVINALNITVTALNEISGNIESVNVIYPDGTMILPDLGYEKVKFNKDMIEDVIGIKLSDDEIHNSLKSMGYKSIIRKNVVEARVPPYRIDVMHPVDIIEDIVKVFGYNNIPRSRPNKFSMAEESNVEIVKERFRKIMIGFGYMEIINLIFTSKERNFYNFGISDEYSPKMVNPIIEDQYIYRTWLFPMLMETLRNNKHRDLPQKIFEIGEVFSKKETIHLACAEISSNASFTEIKGLVGKLFKSIGKELNFIDGKNPFLIDGRQADILINNEKAGFFGEVHPGIIEKFDLGNPVIAFEIDIEKLFQDIFNSRLNFG
ncbi:MAG: phenylalanine--tRNA ligase subunit beta [Thermoplasmata archaeon]|nr:phenylalanine--tRNA ligase subunit beta [Thermoplasmata archaeon]